MGLTITRANPVTPPVTGFTLTDRDGERLSARIEDRGHFDGLVLKSTARGGHPSVEVLVKNTGEVDALISALQEIRQTMRVY